VMQDNNLLLWHVPRHHPGGTITGFHRSSYCYYGSFTRLWKTIHISLHFCNSSISLAAARECVSRCAGLCSQPLFDSDFGRLQKLTSGQECWQDGNVTNNENQ
jgi:hypothetical protein